VERYADHQRDRPTGEGSPRGSGRFPHGSRTNGPEVEIRPPLTTPKSTYPTVWRRVRGCPSAVLLPVSEAVNLFIQLEPHVVGTANEHPGRRLCRTVNGNLEGRADLPHSLVTKSAKSFDKDCNRNTLDRVKIDRASSRNWIVGGFEHNFTCQAADSRRAWSDERSPEPRDCDIPRKHYDGPPTDL
jgi:hypothetical protein